MGMYTTAPSGMVILSSIFVVLRQVRCVLEWYQKVQCGIRENMHVYVRKDLRFTWELVGRVGGSPVSPYPSIANSVWHRTWTLPLGVKRARNGRELYTTV